MWDVNISLAKTHTLAGHGTPYAEYDICAGSRESRREIRYGVKDYCRRRIPAAAGAADATPSGVSRVRVT